MFYIYGVYLGCCVVVDCVFEVFEGEGLFEWVVL